MCNLIASFILIAKLTFLFSQPALQILGTNEDWKPVLQKLGQLLVAVNPDQYFHEYLESFSIFNNRFHFLNEYLYVNKTGGRTSPPPPIETARALQRLSLLLMTGFLTQKFSQLPKDANYTGTTKFVATKEILSGTDRFEKLYHFGYDFAMRDWIMEKHGTIKKIPKKVVDKKVAAKPVAKVPVAKVQVAELTQKVEGLEKKFDDQMQEMKEFMGTVISLLKVKKTKKEKTQQIEEAAVDDEVKEDEDKEE